MIPLTGTLGTFERLMSYTKIGNTININVFFIFNSAGSAGTAYMNLSDLGLPNGVDTGVYLIKSNSSYFGTVVTTDTTNNRLVFNFATSTTGIKFAVFKMFLGCGFRSSY